MRERAVILLYTETYLVLVKEPSCSPLPVPPRSPCFPTQTSRFQPAAPCDWGQHGRDCNPARGGCSLSLTLLISLFISYFSIYFSFLYLFPYLFLCIETVQTRHSAKTPASGLFPAFSHCLPPLFTFLPSSKQALEFRDRISPRCA